MVNKPEIRVSEDVLMLKGVSRSLVHLENDPARVRQLEGWSPVRDEQEYGVLGHAIRY